MQYYFRLTMQKLWRVLVTLDRVFCANVLSYKLDPAPADFSISFSDIREHLIEIEKILKPFILQELDEKSHWVNKVVCGRSKGKDKEKKHIRKLEKMIDLYFIKHQEVMKADACLRLENSLIYKKEGYCPTSI